MPGSRMSPDPTPDPAPEPAAAADPAAPAEDAAPPEPAPKRRWLPRKRPAEPGPAAPGDPSADQDTTAIPEATTPPPPKADGVRQLRRTRKKLLSQREVAVYDLGGLAFELYRRDMLGEEVMKRRAGEVAELDAAVRDIDERLSEIETERKEKRARTPADESAGCCLTCRATFRAEARYCWQCGAQLVPPPPGDEQPTVAIPTPPAT